MRERGHEVFFAVQSGGLLIPEAKKEGFPVYELSFSKKRAPFVLKELFHILKTNSIDLINTHSSRDAWLTGLLGKMNRIPVIRTRHLSTPFKGGLHGLLLYNSLQGDVITSLDGKSITSADQLGAAIQADKPGQSVKIGLWRGQQQMTVTATLASTSEEQSGG